jgi:hypothetical protein
LGYGVGITGIAGRDSPARFWRDRRPLFLSLPMASIPRMFSEILLRPLTRLIYLVASVVLE